MISKQSERKLSFWEWLIGYQLPEISQESAEEEPISEQLEEPEELVAPRSNESELSRQALEEIQQSLQQTQHSQQLHDERLQEISSSMSSLTTSFEEIQKELRKLGKEQFKANTLTEKQNTRLQESLTSTETQQQEQTRHLQTLTTEKGLKARSDLLQSLLPVIDGLDQAILSGYGYLNRLKLQQSLSTTLGATFALSTKEDIAAMNGWVDGLLLVRVRLLGILAADDVRRIETINKPFDPYLHIAAGSIVAPSENLIGIISTEEKAGYITSAGVLRYAEVIVYTKETTSWEEQ